MNVRDVWEVNFPYEDDSMQSKKSPCIIIDIEPLEVSSIKVTYDAKDRYGVAFYIFILIILLIPTL